MKHNNRKLRENGKCLKHRSGALTFIEFIVSFLIVSIASVAVASGIYFAHGTLKRERTKARAVQILKSEMNYWSGRIHSSFPSPHDINRSHTKVVVVDYNADGSPIYGQIVRHDIQGRNDPETALNPDWYELKITLEYTEQPIEPIWIQGAQRKTVHLELYSPMVLSST